VKDRRVFVLVAALVLLLAGKLGKELYDYWAHAEDRVRLVAVRGRLLDAGAEIMRTRAELDSLTRVLDREDGALERERRTLKAYEPEAPGSALPPHLYDAYRAHLDRYNKRVARYNEHLGRRNESFHAWQATLARNRAAVDRYNALADSLRAVAGVLGDPYYQVPTPLEAAAQRSAPPPAP
jgi:hypothetical protein